MIVSHLLFSTRLSFIRKLFGNTTQLSLRICSQSVHLPYRFSKMDTNGSKKEEPFRRLEVPVKGLCDRYEYSVIQLKNGLTALLISDVDNLITLNADEENSLSKEVQSDSEESGDESASSESDSEMEVDEEEGVKKSSDEKLAALSLSVGVGSFCDGKIPGLAHFLEHMVFMGSEKYPEENDFDAFLSTRGGSSNASTEYEYTTFYFEVPEPHLKSSMDIFSNFFISPLLRRDSIQNEMEIVDSEFQSSILNDTCRLEQLLATTCTAQNPAGKFVWGNMDTLGSAGVDEAELYAALQEFRRRYYVADRMTLALQARLDMATLESWVVEHFSGIPSSPSDLAEIPSTQPMPQSTQAKQGPRPTPRFTVETPFELDRWNRFYTVKPVDDINILYLTWFTPPVQDLYPIKPLDMLSWMIGHEGKGSIMSYLRQRHLATELEAGYQDSGFDYNHIYTLFQINVTLTDQGLTQINHIIDIVFQYISLLNQSPITEAMYQEVAQIHRIGFDYSSTKSSSDYTEQLSQNMHYFPSSEYLTGPALYTRHSPSTIQAMLDCFTPARLNIALQSSIVCKRPDQVGVLDGIVSKRPGVENGGLNLDQVEKWFQTEYRVDAIDESCLREWTNVRVLRTTDPALFLPARNQFVATSFDLYPIGNETTESSKYPEPLLKTDQMELWFKQTIKYKLPKTNVYFVLEMPHVKESAQTSVLLDVYLCALNVILQEKTYDAYLAQYFVTVCRGEYGIHVSCNGFSQHMHQFVDIVLTHIKTVDVSRDLFNVCRETLLRQYINNLKDTEVLRRCLRMGILIKTSYMVEDKYRILRDDITYEQLMNFQSTLYDRMFVKCLVMGNITRESALSLSTLCTSRLPFTPLDPSERREIRVTELERCEKIVRVRSLNEKDPNCSVLNYYQSSQVQGTMRESCVIELLVEIVAEPLFDTLRTKMKLGYYVNATVRDTFGVLGISIVVDSQVHKYSVDDIQSKIHGFISRYVRDNEASIAEKYGAIVETVVKKKNMAEVNLKEESSRHFEEIKLNDYQFDRQEKEIELIKQIPLSEVRDWIDNNIVNQGRKLLSIQVVGDGDGTNDAAVSKETEQQAMSTTTTTTTTTTTSQQDHNKRKLSVENEEDQQHQQKNKLPIRTNQNKPINSKTDIGDRKVSNNTVETNVGDARRSNVKPTEEGGDTLMTGIEEGNTVSKDNLNHPKNLNDSKDNINRPKDSLNHPKDHLNHLRDKRNNPKDHLNHPKDHLNHPKDSLNAQKQSRLPLESSTNGDESKGSLSIVSSGKDTRDELVLEYLIPDDAANSDRFIRDIKQYRQSLTEYPVIKLK